MKYAPVLIPTLNRYSHFKKCIESLSQCVWANNTDVFVAVDYPVKEEHWDGYRKIKKYLEQSTFGFNSLNVTYRETNYFYSEKGNLRTLMEDVFKSYDRIIVSEDDNIFSPNFLIYMNRGLELFECDDSVFSINGYIPPLRIKNSNNTFIRQNVDFYAWGYGIWKDRYLNYNRFFDSDGFYQSFCYKKFKMINKNGRYRLNMYLYLASHRKKHKKGDNNLSVYMAIHDMDVIMPTLSLVRNMGWDDSGIHCPTTNIELAKEITNQEISGLDSFNFVGTGLEYYDYNKKVFSKNRERPIVTNYELVKNIIKFPIKRLVNKIVRF